MAILVVDDSRAMRMIVRRELRKAGYDDVVEADNGVQALEAISAGGVDIVLSDWNMPAMNGIELLARLRAEGNTIAFGFVTSESAHDIRARAFEVGADFVVTKPFTGDDLSQHIGLVLGTTSATGSTGAADGEVTLAGVLQGLLGRDVATTDSEGPGRDRTRALAVYRVDDTGSRIYCVVELVLAAAFGCALSRMPASEAEEWGEAHALPEAMEANFHEVANVLAKVASPTLARCVLEEVTIIADGEKLPGVDGDPHWQSAMSVHIDGYPAGRLGFVVL